mmetsp:Transcript_27124/g.66897  ORF Transcript_27124/g.66897 Transcript_27124/m.66897 type:complete len:97 (-) Transcript_27124:613-903(-)
MRQGCHPARARPRCSTMRMGCVITNTATQTSEAAARKIIAQKTTGEPCAAAVTGGTTALAHTISTISTISIDIVLKMITATVVPLITTSIIAARTK